MLGKLEGAEIYGRETKCCLEMSSKGTNWVTEVDFSESYECDHYCSGRRNCSFDGLGENEDRPPISITTRDFFISGITL
jgi:hypothetical protein